MIPHRILLISTQRLGDVLLATPLLRSLRRAYPEARIEVLVYQGTEGILAGNPDCDRVLTVPQRPSRRIHWQFMRSLWRNYDLALTTQASDKAHLYAWVAAPQRVGIIPDRGWKAGWKRLVCQQWVVLDDVNTHTVLQNLQLARLLGIPGIAELVPPSLPLTETLPSRPFAVLHPIPMYPYKEWTIAGWVEVIQTLHAEGLAVYVSAGPSAAERDKVGQILAACPVPATLLPPMPLGSLTQVLKNARLFIGTDTSVTHLAAACGVPAIALFGPSNPVKWGPFPAGWESAEEPFQMRTETGVQQARNVWLVQGIEDCVPCRLEGCDRHRQSVSQCLLGLPAERVKQVIHRILKMNARLLSLGN